MPPDKVVIFDKKIKNGTVLEKVAYLPSGELVVGLQQLAENVWVGKKENSPVDDGKTDENKKARLGQIFCI